jgi:hypothetical protein
MTRDNTTSRARAADLLRRAADTSSASWRSRWTRAAGELLRRAPLDTLSAGELRARAAVLGERGAARLIERAAQLDAAAFERRSAAARKGAETRRQRAAERAAAAAAERARKEARSAAARKGWETRRARELAKPYTARGAIESGDTSTGIAKLVAQVIDLARPRAWASAPVRAVLVIDGIQRGEALELARINGARDIGGVLGQWIWEQVAQRVVQLRAEQGAPVVPEQYQRGGSRPVKGGMALNVRALSQLLDTWQLDAGVTVEPINTL